ncbi:hypothetical protein M406DRAFT_35012 [Cryphonectria parasitica EP155]|uniref:Mitochondrial import inner membrane translocase subunit n=1 Tax=Cryphonectria parasitica (strain ATCC 38755 / EP155) TaxID=660469 RepID=A0A9P4YAR1_CRYP1|nr:uncharacterized protein M406DRAFT_35012 [Cryphonectria parasitica EP155]KAF3769906.1 hypothetical protein M406DRAFT_35012 [Cryphonectria parasitica EP155]
MDSSSFDQADLDRLSAKDKQELRQFINNEQQKAQIQQRSHDLTEMCFKKCVTGSIRSNALEGGEQACLANCVDRFMDASVLAVKHLQGMRQG